MLRLIRRDPKHLADLLVASFPSSMSPSPTTYESSASAAESTVDREATTARAIPRAALVPTPVSEPAESAELAAELTLADDEVLHTCDLIIEPELSTEAITDADRTPVTGSHEWARLIPPPLPDRKR